MNTESVQEQTYLVLVVDDDKSMRMLLRLALEQEGYQVEEASDGEACLAAYQQHQPDAVLLDARMPNLDGFACCTQLRAMGGNYTMPILMITVLDDPDSVEQAFEVGATDYIPKPIHWAVLRHRLCRLLELSVKTRQVESLLQQLEQKNLEIERLASKLADCEGNSLQ